VREKNEGTNTAGANALLKEKGIEIPQQADAGGSGTDTDGSGGTTRLEQRQDDVASSPIYRGGFVIGATRLRKLSPKPAHKKGG
jgi:hypothetical protein